MRAFKRVLIVGVVFLLTAGICSASIGENFEKGGVSIGGGIFFFYDFWTLFDKDNEYNYWYLYLSPRFDFFVADNLSLNVNPYFRYTREHESDEDIYKSMYYGISTGLSYAFVRNPEAQTGLVPSIGGELGFRIVPGVDDTIGGVKDEDKDLSLWLTLGPTFELYYFVTHRISPYLRVEPMFWYRLVYKNDAGEKQDLDFNERLTMDLSIALGITWHIPNKDISIIPRKR